MKKKVIVLLSCAAVCWFLPACGGLSKTPAKTINADIERIIDDIDLENYFTSDFVYDSPYQYVESKLQKRQTNREDKEDIIYYDVKIKNEYFEIISTYKLTYNYYDEGGWILEETELEDEKVVPIKAAEADLILEKWNEKLKYYNRTDYVYRDSTDFYGYFDDFHIEITDVESELNTENFQTRLHVDLTVSLSEMKGYIPLEFDSELGWEIMDTNNEDEDETEVLCYYVTDLKCDYSKAEGTFIYESGYAKYTLSFTIDEEKGIVDTIYTIDYDTGTSSKTENKYNFNPIEGAFASIQYYDSNRDVWIGNTSIYERQE